MKDFAEKVLTNPENIMAICESSEIDCSIFINNYIKTGDYEHLGIPDYIKLHLQGEYELVSNKTFKVNDAEKHSSYYVHMLTVKKEGGVESIEFHFNYDEKLDQLYFTAMRCGPYDTDDVIWDDE